MVGTIGVFDGVHRGHRELLSRVVHEAKARSAESMVVTFDPHPIEVFAPEAPPHRLAVREVALRRFAETGVDWVWFLPFSRAMAELSPREFVGMLTAELDLQGLWLGHDFRFGKDRAGDASFLREVGDSLGFDVRKLDAIEEGVRPISSTWIRECVREGRVEDAAELLGALLEVEGTVVAGRGRGSKEFVPTANLGLPSSLLLPGNGIYAGWASDPAHQWSNDWLPAVASVGERPTTEIQGPMWAEVHIMDWSGSIYGHRLAFRFAEWMRAEEAFPNLGALREAILEDVAEAGRRLSRRRPGQ